MKTETIAQRAKRLLEAIPENEWITSFYTEPDRKVCCAIGHFQRLSSDNPSDYSQKNCSDGSESLELRKVSSEYLQEVFRTKPTDCVDIAYINNKPFKNYNQTIPKQRVMALLADMIEAGL